MGQPLNRRRVAIRLAFAAVIGLALWLSFFDSHSLMKRMRWHHERGELARENEQLASEIERLESEIEKGLSDEMAEKIAREQYRMRRPGEKVYPIKESK